MKSAKTVNEAHFLSFVLTIVYRNSAIVRAKGSNFDYPCHKSIFGIKISFRERRREQRN